MSRDAVHLPLRWSTTFSSRRSLAAAALALVLSGAYWHAISRERASVSAAGAPAAESSRTAAGAPVPLTARSALPPMLPVPDASYRVALSGAALGAQNPAQGFRLRFDRGGLRLSSGALRLAFGRPLLHIAGSTLAPGRVAPTTTGSRVTFAFGAFSEWYVNAPSGLEQGFTLSRPPAGSATGRLTIALPLSGNTLPHLSAAARSVVFTRPGARSLRYGALAASDASGRTLPSSIALRGGTVLLTVDARGAHYPLTVDPLIQQGEKLTAGDASPMGFFGNGLALSADGSTAVIGAPGEDGFAGAAWVFNRSGSTWAPDAEDLAASEPGGGPAECGEEPGGEDGEEPEQCGFGASAALSTDGSTILIGGPRAGGQRGAAWVFTRTGSTWSRQQLTGGEEVGEAHFGRSVALSADGNTALIGGGADRAGRGAAWVFTRTGGTWAPQGPKLTGSGEMSAGRFGRSVALSLDGATALIGGSADDEHLGAAWVFTRTAGTWAQQGAKLTGGGEAGQGRFGYALALSADASTALIGGRTDNASSGAVWTFTRSGVTWAQQGSKLTAAGESGPGEFGYGLALSADGETALIGSPRENTSLGVVRQFTRSGLSWQQQPEELAGSGESGRGWFGSRLALSGDAATALVGAPHDSGKTGAAWLFTDMAAPTLLPTLSRVTPSSGPAAGGTTVTITGTNFTGTSAVRFGSVSASSFTVGSADSITAVSPSAAGPVDVTVSTPAGTSAVSSQDRFRFIAPPQPESGPGEGGATPPPSGAAMSSAFVGVLGFGPLAGGMTQGCRVSLLSRSIVVRAARAALRLISRGTATCPGHLTLTVTRRVPGRRSRARTIGAGVFSIAPAARLVVKVKLNADGRALLNKAHGRISASLRILGLSPGSPAAQTASVRLTAAKAPHASP